MAAKGYKRYSDDEPVFESVNKKMKNDVTVKRKDSMQLEGATPLPKQMKTTTLAPSHSTSPSTYSPSNSSSKQGGSRPHPSILSKKKHLLDKERKKLPIWQGNSNIDIKYNLRYTSNVAIISAETGSGKSTQVPHMLSLEPWCVEKKVDIIKDGKLQENVSVGGIIAVTEPRRVAVTSLASRVAAEMGSYLNKGGMTKEDKVGYAVRFDHQIPAGMKVKFMTEGMLLQELNADPALKRYSAVIVDEIHERSVDVDIITGFLRRMVKPDYQGRGGIPMRVVIMSATANVKQIKEYFEEKHPGDVSTNGSESNRGPNSKKQLTNGTADVTAVGVERGSSEATESSWEGIEDSGPNVQPVQAHTSDTDAQTQTEKIMGCYDPARFKQVTEQHIGGKIHEVTLYHATSKTEDYIEQMVIRVAHCNDYEPTGDILCFLPGQPDIEAMADLLERRMSQYNVNTIKRDGKLPMKVIQLYGSQSMEEQRKVFERPAKIFGMMPRKVILATNIAETSITIPGVKYVVDSCRAKIKRYRPQLGLETLLVEMISKSAMRQREGRAGRESEGKVWNMLTAEEAEAAPAHDDPEIERSNIVSAVLRMKVAGIEDVYNFALLTPPPHAAVRKAEEILYTLNAVDSHNRVTPHGRIINRFPLAPELSHVLIMASEQQDDDACLLLAIDVVAIITSSEDVFRHASSDDQNDEYDSARSDLMRSEGDILTFATTMGRYAAETTDRTEWCKKRFVNNIHMKTALQIRKQLRSLCMSQKLLSAEPPADPQPFTPPSQDEATRLLKCFLSAFVDQTAMLNADGGYHLVQGDRSVIAIHPSSCLMGKKMEAIMFLEHVYTNKNYAKKVSRIEANWIAESLMARMA